MQLAPDVDVKIAEAVPRVVPVSISRAMIFFKCVGSKESPRDQQVQHVKCRVI